MNDLEDVLRDALSARASVVTFDPDAYDAVVARRERRRAIQWLRPLGAAAATVAVVGLVAVVRPATPGVSPVPAASAPSYVATVHGKQVEIRDPQNITAPPVMTGPTGYGSVRDVAAVGDGRTFYAAVSVPKTCGTAFLRLDVQARTTKEVTRVAVRATAIAVTRDERRLAYTVAADSTSPATSPNAGTPCSRDVAPALVVRDLVTGAVRTWTRPPGKTRVIDEHGVVDWDVMGISTSTLSWSPDGQYLAYESRVSIARLDTAAATTTYAEEPVGGFVRRADGAVCSARSPAYLPSGELAALLYCPKPITGDSPPKSGQFDAEDPVDDQAAVVFDPASQTVGRTLFRLPAVMPVWLALDATGEHAYVAAFAAWTEGEKFNGQRGDPAMYIWDAGTDSARRVTGKSVDALLDFTDDPDRQELTGFTAW